MVILSPGGLAFLSALLGEDSLLTERFLIGRVVRLAFRGLWWIVTMPNDNHRHHGSDRLEDNLAGQHSNVREWGEKRKNHLALCLFLR